MKLTVPDLHSAPTYCLLMTYRSLPSQHNVTGHSSFASSIFWC